jgi:hypothetical protein
METVGVAPGVGSSPSGPTGFSHDVKKQLPMIRSELQKAKNFFIVN